MAEGANNATGVSNTFPTSDAQGNPLTAEYGYCVYKDSQTITL